MKSIYIPPVTQRLSLTTASLLALSSRTIKYQSDTYDDASNSLSNHQIWSAGEWPASHHDAP